MKDGTRSPRIPLDARTKKQAHGQIAAMQAVEDRERTYYLAKVGEVVLPAPDEDLETVDAWYARFAASQECGAGHRRVTGKFWGKWVSPILGSKTMATLRAEDLEEVRDKLDVTLRGGLLQPATARNIWSIVTAAMKAAAHAKDRSLRVHKSPIYVGILPPRPGRSRVRPWLYPTEWLTLARCPQVPADWRRVYALALYTGLRPNELRALRWEHVDTTAGLVRVTEAWDPEAKGIKVTKTEAGHRVVPLRPELLPLLRERAPDDELVLQIPWTRIAQRLRVHLETAGVSRPRLRATSATEMPMDFRALRDTYATWRALEGADVLSLKRELGHEDLSTTDAYVKEAASHRGAAVGEPFPRFSFGSNSQNSSQAGWRVQNSFKKQVRMAGFEPAEIEDSSSNSGVSRAPESPIGPRSADIAPRYLPGLGDTLGDYAAEVTHLALFLEDLELGHGPEINSRGGGEA